MEASATRANSRRRPWIVLLAAGVLTAIGLALSWGCGRHGPPVEVEEPVPPHDALPELPASPFLNTRQGVRHVGGAACTPCHRQKAESYARHPMGRSLAPLAAVLAEQRLDAEAGNPFTAAGLRFQVERHEGRLWHKATAAQATVDLRAALSSTAEVQFVLGSGRQGRSYLTERDGFLFLSPISWFSTKGTWGLAPAYQGRPADFLPPITPDCLFCHSNGSRGVAGAVNHFEKPLFPNGHAIGCERCHGPGELHVAAREGGGEHPGTDHTIVNPARLDTGLRDAVCEQCHLLGVERVARRGRTLDQFRPGLPLELFLSVFVWPPEQTEGHKSVGELEQLADSRCFQKSGGKLACTSCHDPHRLPEQEERVAYYRGRCLKCHGETSCGLDPAARRAKSAGDSCIDCHMPRVGSSDIAHASLTDHRILRRPLPPLMPRLILRPGEVPLRYFRHGAADPPEEVMTRDLAIAVMRQAPWVGQGAQRELIAGTARAPLEGSLHRAPNDPDAWQVLALTYRLLGRHADALAAAEKALALAPGFEAALAEAAESSLEANRSDAALDYARRLAAVDPWQPGYQNLLAKVHAQRHEWAEALAACRRSVALDPTSLPGRTLLVIYLVRSGEKERARAEFATILALKPADADQLRHWFDGLMP